MNTASTLPATTAFFGRRVVQAAFVMAVFGWGVGFYGPPIFLQAVMQRSGWPLLLVSSAVTLHFLAGVLVIAWLPRLHQRFGIPAVVMAGAALTALGVCGWALAADPWQLALAALASGTGWVNLGAVTVNAVVSRWHQRSRPLALGRAYNGASIGGALFAPLWVGLIRHLGFPWAAVLVGTAMLLAMALLARRVFAKSPQDLRQQVDGDASAPPAALASSESAAAAHPGTASASLPGNALWRSRSFQTLAAAMALGLFAQVGLLAHLFSLLVPRLGADRAGWLMGACTACAIAGRSAAARLLMRTGDRRVVAAASYAVQAVGALGLVLAAREGQPLAALLLGTLLFGLGIGNATSLPPLVAQSDFAAPDMPRVVALIVAIAQAGYAFAPAVFGALLAGRSVGAAPAGPLIDGSIAPGSSWASGTVLFAGAAALQLLAAAVMLAGRKPG